MRRPDMSPVRGASSGNLPAPLLSSRPYGFNAITVELYRVRRVDVMMQPAEHMSLPLLDSIVGDVGAADDHIKLVDNFGTPDAVIEKRMAWRMSGMPAFGKTHDARELWNIVSFVEQLPTMTGGGLRATRRRACRSACGASSLARNHVAPASPYTRIGAVT